MPSRPALFRPRYAGGGKRERRQLYDRQRGSSTARGYDAAWQKLRAAFLAAQPFCAFCRLRGKITAAAVVDHKVRIEEWPEGRLEWRNLQPLCKACHDGEKQRQDQARQRRRY